MMRILIFLIYDSKIPLEPIGDAEGAYHGYDEDPCLFHVRFNSPVRVDWRCRGCVVIITIMTVGGAEDAK